MKFFKLRILQYVTDHWQKLNRPSTWKYVPGFHLSRKISLFLGSLKNCSVFFKRAKLTIGSGKYFKGLSIQFGANYLTKICGYLESWMFFSFLEIMYFLFHPSRQYFSTFSSPSLVVMVSQMFKKKFLLQNFVAIVLFTNQSPFRRSIVFAYFCMKTFL